MEVSDTKRLRELEQENAQLKRMVRAFARCADFERPELKKMMSLAERRRGADCLEQGNGVSEGRAC